MLGRLRGRPIDTASTRALCLLMDCARGVSSDGSRRLVRVRFQIGCVEVTAVFQGVAADEKYRAEGRDQRFHRAMQPEGSRAVNERETSECERKPRLENQLPSFLLGRQCELRWGLWTGGLRTPPGQECSNGSLIFFAVVLRRTFPSEAAEGENSAVC